MWQYMLKDADPQYLRTYTSELTVANRYHNAWHKWKWFHCAVGGGFVALIIYLGFDVELKAILSGLLSGVFIWIGGDILLNRSMGWKLFERGDKSGLDRFSYWVRLGLLAVIIASMFISCSSPQPKEDGKIQRAFATQPKSMLIVKRFVNPNNGAVYHYYSGEILGDKKFDRIKIEGDSIPERFLSKQLAWQMDNWEYYTDSLRRNNNIINSSKDKRQ